MCNTHDSFTPLKSAINHSFKKQPDATYENSNRCDQVACEKRFQTVYGLPIYATPGSDSKGFLQHIDRYGQSNTIWKQEMQDLINIFDVTSRNVTPMGIFWGYCSMRSKSHEKINSKQFKYCFILTPFLSNFAEFDAENWPFCTIFGPLFGSLAVICQFSASNSARLGCRRI